MAKWSQAEGPEFYPPDRWILARAWTDFDWYVAACERMRFAGAPPELTVALDVHWAFAGPTLVGEFYLFDEPMAGDNHIGYKVQPSFPWQGVATALLRYGLDQIGERGIHLARLSCRDSNLASAAIIEHAGSERLADKLMEDGEVLRRYVMPTQAPSRQEPSV